MASQPFTITPVTHSQTQDLADIRALFTAYTASLDIDLTFQDYSTELSSLPGKYAPPHGALFLACSINTKNSIDTGEAIGCVALRPLPSRPNSSNPTASTVDAEARYCEMKRLYVCPSGRGTGLGRALATKAIEEARRLGYAAMRLDTLPLMSSAQALYKSLGFREIEAYYESPIEGTVFLELDLTASH